MTIEERLDALEDTIQNEDFLQGKGLGNEVPFWIFDYPPEKEMLIRSRIPKLKENLKLKSINILEIDLYELCLEIITAKIPMERILQFEADKGSDKLLDKLRLMLKPANIQRAIRKKIGYFGDVNIIIITGVGKAWPLIRSHSILNNLQPVVDDMPLILFYPGKYSGLDLSLFGKFKDGNYYRAFRLVDDSAIDS
ncbi:DUF1788 domain-containing protein [Methanohalophilus sp. DAL1]|jgi:hypothetical protein|uniref:DUF1788 domain-containing protein n=1 Tax=Methanohalophilus sp. DAL1 TaxID=1864608 RepID=UPI000818399C|nr:DUF1788 domain-containing protein [Methanohalophilus sp. DAL1]OBZ35400.1 MAG: hypothetical protein A9957_07280 [Methanohalophilus sp. DAL1]